MNLGQQLVFYRGKSARLNKSQFNAFLLVYYYNPVEVEFAMDVLYGHDINGGPIGWVKHFDVLASQMNQQLKKIGLAVRAPRHHYRILAEL